MQEKPRTPGLAGNLGVASETFAWEGSRHGVRSQVKTALR
jgi:hypothetical protein